MGWFSSDEPNEEVQVLIDNAKHDSVTAEVLSNKDSSAWGAHNYLNDRPLINHLNQGEQPHFITHMTNSQGGGIFTESSEDLLPNGKLRTNIAVTDQRILVVIGDKNGDREKAVNYDEILDIDRNTKNIDNNKIFELSITTEEETYQIRSTPLTKTKLTDDEIVEYIRKQIPDYGKELSDGTVVNYEINADVLTHIESSKIGEDHDLPFEGGPYQNIAFSESGFSINPTTHWRSKDSNLEVIPYSEIADIKYYRSIGFENSLATLLRLIYDDSDRFIHIYFILNKREIDVGETLKRMQSGGMKTDLKNNTPTCSPEKLEEIEGFVDSRVTDTSNKSPVYVLNEWIEDNAELKIQGWQQGSSELSGVINGTTNSSGKSKGIEIGPFTRAKTKSNSTIDADLQGEISDNTFSSDIINFQVFENGVHVVSDPILDFSYKNIDKVVKRNSGMIIESGQTSYSISGLPRPNFDEIIDFLQRKVDSSSTQSDSNNQNSDDDKNETEKIREVKQLYEDGIITEEEFESKKQGLLDDL